jgi:transposase
MRATAHHPDALGREGDGTAAYSHRVMEFELRHGRYLGPEKTHLRQEATAAATNFDGLAAWFVDRPRAQTRVTRFAALVA